jgi:hypothetical protein
MSVVSISGDAAADVPRYIDEWLSQFGASRLLPLSFGGTRPFVVVVCVAAAVAE